MKNKMTVLIVEDEKINREVLNNLLKSDCKIMVAKNGIQALKIANGAHPPDLILLDVLMPEMDGYEVCRLLKSEETTQDIPIIFVTALGDEEAETKGFELGAVDYITKPISPAVVKARVHTHLRLQSQNNLIKLWATRDGLTGIPNRRAFDQGCSREWARALREQHPLAMLMIDVDMFKPYNDHYGHGPGDDCLIQIAKALAECIHRPGDSVARYGGEEFAAILSDTDVEGAALMGENFRQAIAELKIPHAYSEVADHVTISVGGASCATLDKTAPEDLLKAADRMLYEAKEGGRNRVKVGNFGLT